jgi:hypothetical protein
MSNEMIDLIFAELKRGKSIYPVIINAEDRKEIANQYKEYLTRFDMRYLAECFSNGLQNKEMEDMYEIIVMAAMRRKAEDNKVIHLDEDTIQQIKANYPKYDKKETELYAELDKKQGFSITGKQQWILNKLLEAGKRK